MTTADNTRLTPNASPTNKSNIDPHAVTISGIVLNPSYTPDQPPESLKNIDRDIAAPGKFPYTRGLFPEGYRTRLWTMRQFAGFGSAEDTNKRFKYLLNAAKTGKTKANTGLSTAFDLPTLMGRDSDDPLSMGEVGKCGVAIDTIEDMHRLYADIPIDQVTVSQTINGPAAVIWAMYLAMAQQRGIAWNTLGGTLQNDILKEFHSQNEFIYPPEASTKLVVDTIEFQSQHLPKWNSVSISGYHIREAGSSATQELAFTLRDGMEYVEACLIRGLDIEQFAPRLSFFFNAHNEFFEEIAKLRAARRIWARMMKDRYHAQNERSWFMKTHVQTAGCSLTEQQPLNNIVRVAYQAMAAVLGGCQSLHTDSMDETLGLPTEQAVTVALRTQQILAHETGVTRTTDPLGGSWFMESLTDTVESEALDYIAEIDAMGRGPWKPEHAADSTLDDGGVVNGIHKGYFRRQIAEASYRFSEECENHDRIIVGVNEYTDKDEGRPIDILTIGPEVETDQTDRLADFKKRRDKDAVHRALDDIRESARNNENVMPALIEGALSNCTLGEMVQAMADVYGRYTGGPEW
ncbi:MAG: methylmalonyl-CoA mutase family protein [Phycisphaerales bacterium]|nr:methylmalonyl-CoA mutase [Planctomycetota bacterium]MCH8507557.1 methylmalonyl-CoA mutase family protein [Phycisphaerales bacterium]